MNWRRVILSVGFAVAVTTLGFAMPHGPAAAVLLPAVVARSLFTFLTVGSRESWLAIWLMVYAQLFFWALVWEVFRLLFSRLRGWSAKRAVRV
jgi:hypothetical protein